MLKLISAPKAISRIIGRAGLTLSKHAPEILTGAGVAGFIASLILASKASFELPDVLDDMHVDLRVAKREAVTNENAPDYKKEALHIYTKGALNIAKLYAPTVIVSAMSILCVCGSTKISIRRNAALTATLTSVSNLFSDYRARVVQEYGEDAERHIYYNTEYKIVDTDEIRDESGKVISKSKKVTAEVPGPIKYSQYARFFDEANIYWRNSYLYNRNFIVDVQNTANDILHRRGHIFLNEVYDMLGLPRSQAGAVVGWVDDGKHDGYVDFGVFSKDQPQVRDFVNGYEKSILLDFNVDGVIYDLI